MITVEHAASCVQISFQNGALFLFAQQAANYLGSEWMRPPVDHDLRKDWRHPAIATILKGLKGYHDFLAADRGEKGNTNGVAKPIYFLI